MRVHQPGGHLTRSRGANVEDWSWGATVRRVKTLALMATLPGLPLYENYGFRVLEYSDVLLPDGVAIGCASMEKPIA